MRENEFIREYLKSTDFITEDRIGIVNNPLITVIVDGEILFHSSPKEFNFNDLIYRLTNQEYAMRNNFRAERILEHKRCGELIGILTQLRREYKIKQLI